MFAYQEGLAARARIDPCPCRPGPKRRGQALPEFMKGVGAARFGVMAGVAAALTAFFLYIAGVISEPPQSILMPVWLRATPARSQPSSTP